MLVEPMLYLVKIEIVVRMPCLSMANIGLVTSDYTIDLEANICWPYRLMDLQVKMKVTIKLKD